MSSSADNSKIKSVIETKGFKFQIRAGNQKWECTLLDRATHERRKSIRTDSSSSVSSMASTSSSASTVSH